MAHRVNVYDFDHTVYKGDASFDFIAFCMRRDPALWRYLPKQFFAIVRYIFGTYSRQQVKQDAFAILRSVKNIDAVVNAFWDTHQQGVAPWYKTKQQPTDVFVSASPEFLLKPIMLRLGVATLIATPMDTRTGHITGMNCRAEEKVRRLHEHDPDLIIGDVYSDSMSDMPLFALAQHAYVVKGEVITPLADYTPPKGRALRDPAFLRFLIVGGINASLGIIFSYIIALLIDSPLVAYALGYSLSLIISYFLNAVITFAERNFSMKQFVNFCLSYIPNFVIVVSIVYVLVDVLHVYSLVAYILAALVAAPVTFLLLSKFTFLRRDQHEKT